MNIGTIFLKYLILELRYQFKKKCQHNFYDFYLTRLNIFVDSTKVQ